MLNRGDLEAAKRLYAQLCKQDPGNIQGWFALTAIHARTGNMKGVIDCSQRLVVLTPGDARVLFNLGVAQQQLGHSVDAIEAFQNCLRLNPGDARVLVHLGNACMAVGRIEDAARYYGEAIDLEASSLAAHFNLGNALVQLGEFEQAIESYRHALRLKPGHGAVLNALGVVLLRSSRPEEARTVLQSAVVAEPQSAYAHTNLGNACEMQGLLEEAIAEHREAIRLDGHLADAHYNLANALVARNRLCAAIDEYRCALELAPDNVEMLNNLGNAQVLCGDIPGSIDTYRRAVRLDADCETAHSNLLFTMMCDSASRPEEIFREHKAWAAVHAADIRPMEWSAERFNNKDKLHIAYLSPDFCKHSVASFIEPVLRHHDRERFDVSCYANVKRADAVTSSLRKLCGRWRDIRGMKDEAVVDLVREDGVDILVDLAGHSADNRLLVFASRPAPVQVTCLGYPNTTGLETIDYRISDEWADPQGEADRLHTERLVRLPGGFLCYAPPPDSPSVAPLPADNNGFVTFGSFNNLAKIDHQVIEAWAGLLQAVPKSRLLLKHLAFEEEETRESYLVRFEGLGVNRNRIELVKWVDSSSGHLGAYSRVDIALDTFPYNGTTTSCEALWMGVPVVTVAGNSHVSRVGVSLLTSLGLQQMIAGSQQQYVEIAARLAADMQVLGELRSTLRDRMAGSRLCDGKAFTRTLEVAYRKMWADHAGVG